MNKHFKYRQKYNAEIRVRITNLQRQQLENLRQICGFKNISDYARKRLLEEDSIVLSKLNEIINALKPNK